MYVRKNELIQRLVTLTNKTYQELMLLTMKELCAMYEQCSSKEKRKYINVPYKEKDLAKLLGAKYDGKAKKWYIPPGVNEKYFDEFGMLQDKE
ncbi:MAG: hypothetical protein II305_02965 [Clostridia bacterium]|nr:hypothetical protein [Clostridia bacterium]